MLLEIFFAISACGVSLILAVSRRAPRNLAPPPPGVSQHPSPLKRNKERKVPKKRYIVTLTAEERSYLRGLISKGKSKQNGRALRAVTISDAMNCVGSLNDRRRR